MNTLLTRLAHACILIAAASLLALAGVEAWQVFARYVLNDSPGWTEPVALLLMSTAMMFGAAVCVRQDAHFGFYLGVAAAPPRLQRLLRGLSALVMVLVGLALCVWGAALTAADWDVPMAGAALPEGLRFLPVAVGGGLITLFALERLLSPAPPANPTLAHADNAEETR